MTGQQTGFLGQRKDLGADAFDQQARISSGEVRSPNAVLENQIPAEAHPCFGTIQNHMPGGVAGSVAHLEFHFSQLQDLSVRKFDTGLWTGINLESKERCTPFSPPQGMVAGVQGYQRKWIKRIRDGTRSAYMIEVSMRVPEMAYPPVTFLCGGQYDIPIPGRVNDSRLPGFIISHEVGIGLDGSEGEVGNFKHGVNRVNQVRSIRLSSGWKVQVSWVQISS